MAFPVVESRTCTTYSTAVDISSLDIDFPSSVASDNLLILIVSRSYDRDIAAPAGWTTLSNNSPPNNYAGRLATFYKQASGNEGGTTVTVSLTSQSTPSMAGVIYEISGWNDAEISVNDPAKVGVTTDFNSLTPSWGAKDTLWVAAVGTGDEGELVTNFAADGFATNGANCRSNRGTDQSCNIGHSYQTSNTATLDPAGWTVADTESLHEHLIGVEPGTKGGAGGSDNLTPTDVESASELDSPALTQVHALTATDVESASEVDAPAVTQIHALSAVDVTSLSEISATALGGPGVDALSPTDLEALSEVDTPALTQTHALTAPDLEAVSQISVPSITGDIDLALIYSRVNEIWKILGLDSENPMTVTPTSRVAGDISQTISGDGTTSTTVTRD